MAETPNIVNLTSENFDSIISDSDIPVVVDFWADWCGPCRMIAPILETIAVERSGEVLIAKVDIVAHPELGQRLGVMSIPTVVTFRDGLEANRSIGAKGKDKMVEELGI